MTKKPTNVVYLFGAGASANVLPTINQLHDSIKDVAEKIRSDVDLSNNLINSYGLQLDSCVEALNWLAEIANPDNNFTIDTYAKQLFIQSKVDDLKKLKIVLTFFFLYKESCEQSIDRRYLNFWTNLVDASKKLPENVTLMTWNYDRQLEKTYQLLTLEGLNGVSIKGLEDKNTRTFLHKLNGSAEFYEPDNNNNKKLLTDKFKNNKANLVRDFLGLLKHIPKLNREDTMGSLISYAWEGGAGIQPHSFVASFTHWDTEVLVVVGYSFPYFNREIDRQIFGESANRLRKVYIQLPKDSIDDVLMRFQAIRDVRNIELIGITDTQQFFIPPEL